ncbi:LOW QUALITY PROTEIN: tyrosine-protein phosphatase non-receptor type 23 [Porphyrio hochstetteri]
MMVKNHQEGLRTGSTTRPREGAGGDCQFLDSLQLDPDTVDNLELFSHIPPVLMEKCAALSVRPDTVRSLVQSMQVLSGVFTDVEASLKEIQDLLEEDELQERKLQELLGKVPPPQGSPPASSSSSSSSGLAEVSRECAKYVEVHEKASFTNTELHRAMNLHIGNLRLLSGPLEQVRAALPTPSLTEDDKQVLQNLKRILAKVQEMRDQRASLEQQLRDMIQKDDITTSLVTTDRSEMKKLFEEQLKKYDQIKVYLEQNLAAQENVLKALTDANVKYAAVRKALAEVEHKWNTTVQTLVASYEAYEDLMKKSQEGKDFYTDLEGKATRLLEKARAACRATEANRQQLLEREMKKHPPPRPTAPKPPLQKKPLELDPAGLDPVELPLPLVLPELPEELRALPPDVLAGHLARLPPSSLAALAATPRPPEPFVPLEPFVPPSGLPFAPTRLPAPPTLPPTLPGHYRLPGGPTSAPSPFPPPGGVQLLPPSAPQPAGVPPPGSVPSGAPQLFPGAPLLRPPVQPGYVGPPVLPPRSSPQHCPPSAAPYTLGQPGGPTPSPLAPPGAQQRVGGPEQTPGARPATTTVDSVQAPISSCAPPRLPSQGPAVPPGPFLHPGGPQPPFPYTQGGPQPFGQPARPPFPPGQHPHTFTLTPQLQPGGEMPPRPPAPQQFPPAPFLPPGSTQLPLPFQQPPRPPLPPQFPQQPFTGPGGQLPPPASGQPPQIYQLPGQDKLPPPHTGALPFPRAPPVQSGPPGQPLHTTLGGLQPVPFAPPGSQVPPGPVAMGPPPASQTPPHRVAPSPSPGLSQVQGAAVVQGPLIPSPAPSPQPGPSSGSTLPQRPPPSLTPGAAPLPPGPGEAPFQRQSSSTDDLLSSSPESQHGGSKAAVGLLQPTKADAKEGQRPKTVQLIENDPYEKPERVLHLLEELERFRGLVERLERPNPVAELDVIWKELQDAQERDARQLSIAIARCYSMKNRHQDIMPYDRNRVVLRSGKDDYINASRVEDLSPYCPTIIATQAPLLGTAADFWLMIYEQKVSVIVMLVSEQELDKQKVLRYFPPERGQPMVQGPITLILTGLKVAPTHVERVITLQYRDQSLKRTVIHLQFTSWPELGLPESKGSLLRFIQEVHGHYLHQRPLHTPIVVHCSSGVGRTGAFCLLYAAVQELEAGNGIPDLAWLVKRLRQQRKHMLQEKLHLKFCYEAVLLHAEQVLHRHGGRPQGPQQLLPQGAHSSSLPQLYFPQDPQDLVLGGDVPISSIQATIAKLSIKPAGGSSEGGAGWGVQDPPPQTDAPSDAEVLPDGTMDGVSAPEPSPPGPPIPEPPVPTESSTPPPEGPETPQGEPVAPPVAPSSSSLELLASLTPEAFTLDASLKGKQRMNKQNFLQAQPGEGLRGPRPSDDPLSMLDPLWTLNKT